MEDDGMTTANKRLDIYVSITLGEIPAVLVLVKEPRHLRDLWGAEELPWYYSQPSPWDGEVVAFV